MTEPPALAATSSVVVSGTWHPDFTGAVEEFARQLEPAGVGGAAFATYHRGEKVVDVWAGDRDGEGTPWERDTLVMCQSTTKGVSATALHLCVERGLLDYGDRVADHWPAFAQGGKRDITVADLLTHQAGLFPVAPLVVDALQMNDANHMTAALETALPVHPPGAANGYHAFTYGWLVGELVRRCTGSSIGTFIRDELAGPLGCDGLHLGLPASDVDRLATLLPARPTERSPLLQRLADDSGSGAAAPDGTPSLEWSIDNVLLALSPPGIDRWLVAPETPRAEVPAAGGCFTARDLARLYAMWAEGGALDGVRLFAPERVERVRRAETDRSDLVLFIPMQWRLGFHPPFTADGVVEGGFGHNGFGGSGAWADPARRLSVAFTLNGLSGASALGDGRFAQLGSATVRAADERR